MAAVSRRTVMAYQDSAIGTARTLSDRNDCCVAKRSGGQCNWPPQLARFLGQQIVEYQPWAVAKPITEVHDRDREALRANCLRAFEGRHFTGLLENFRRK